MDTKLDKISLRNERFLARFSHSPIMARNYVAFLNQFRLFLSTNRISYREIAELCDLHLSSVTRIIDLCYVPSAPILVMIQDAARSIYLSRLAGAKLSSIKQ